jgi:hypothetical protein
MDALVEFDLCICQALFRQLPAHPELAPPQVHKGGIGGQVLCVVEVTLCGGFVCVGVYVGVR